jgi:hypothetical protein
MMVVRVQDAWGMGLLHEVTNIEDRLNRAALDNFQLCLGH